MTPLQELQKLVLQCDVSILYKPLEGEIEYRNPTFPLEIHPNNILLTYDKHSDAFEWAERCVEKFKDTKPFILIPGKLFDLHGMRLGKGGGWYDRFLTKIPSTWLKIGVANTSQISTEKIPKKPWDVTMDWIIVTDQNSWYSHKTQ